MPSKQSDTEKLAYDKIMQPGARESMYKKIITCLLTIQEGSSYKIADYLGCKPDKVWKRISELRAAGIIIDTGKRSLTPDGNLAMVYALASQHHKYTHIEKPVVFKKKSKGVGYYANEILKNTNQMRLF